MEAIDDAVDRRRNILEFDDAPHKKYHWFIYMPNRFLISMYRF
jgi:hypothetical protein